MNNYLKAAVFGTVLAGTCANVTYAQDDSMQMALLRMQNQVTELQEKLAQSQGQIESLEHDIKLLTEENNKLKQQLSSQSAPKTENSDSKQDSSETAQSKTDEKTAETASKNGAASALPIVPAEAKAQYDKAYSLVDSKKYDEAVSAFEAYVQKYEDNALTPNAWYWMGQIQYSQKKYEAARVSFLHTAKFQSSNKRMDALYKLGIISKTVGDKDKAKRFFELLIQNYPNSTSSVLAKRELDALN